MDIQRVVQHKAISIKLMMIHETDLMLQTSDIDADRGDGQN